MISNASSHEFAMFFIQDVDKHFILPRVFKTCFSVFFFLPKLRWQNNLVNLNEDRLLLAGVNFFFVRFKSAY